MTEQLAIMREVGYGCRDVGYPVLWFSTYVRECRAALQVLGQEDATKLITDMQVHDVHDLEGKPCWVDVDGNRMVFLRAWK